MGGEVVCLDDGYGDLGAPEKRVRVKAVSSSDEFEAGAGGADGDGVDQAVGCDLVAESADGILVDIETAVGGVWRVNEVDRKNLLVGVGRRSRRRLGWRGSRRV